MQTGVGRHLLWQQESVMPSLDSIPVIPLSMLITFHLEPTTHTSAEVNPAPITLILATWPANNENQTKSKVRS